MRLKAGGKVYTNLTDLTRGGGKPGSYFVRVCYRGPTTEKFGKRNVRLRNTNKNLGYGKKAIKELWEQWGLIILSLQLYVYFFATLGSVTSIQGIS